jgi:hypothetical protein
MLPYTPAQFTARSLTVAEGHCVHCNAPTERDSDGYSSTCLRCFGLGHKAFGLEHSHMFQYPEGYARVAGGQHAWPTSVRMSPAFVGGEHVGWYCPGGHGQEPCGWAPTHAEVAHLVTLPLPR